MLLFLVTTCLVVAVQPCMEWIPIFKKKCVTVHHVSKYMSCHKAIVVITRTAHWFFMITYILCPCSYFCEVWALCVSWITHDHFMYMSINIVTKEFPNKEKTSILHSQFHADTTAIFSQISHIVKVITV